MIKFEIIKKVEVPQEIKDMMKREKELIINKKQIFFKSFPYPMIRVNGVLMREHIFVWKKNNGSISKGMVIHHKNGNKIDNRIENLRLVTLSKHMELHKTMNKL